MISRRTMLSNENFTKIAEHHASSQAYGRMPFEAVNKIEEVARDPEKVVPQSDVYLVAIIHCDRCNLCYVFSSC